MLHGGRIFGNNVVRKPRGYSKRSEVVVKELRDASNITGDLRVVEVLVLDLELTR
jgi:hypothetical protein